MKLNWFRFLGYGVAGTVAGLDIDYTFLKGVFVGVVIFALELDAYRSGKIDGLEQLRRNLQNRRT